MLEGQTIKDRYKVYDRLGSGGAATVYLARDIETGQMVVVKLVHPHVVNDQFIGRFEREIELLKQIDNPYIIKLFDWGIREEEPVSGQIISYIITEFVEGHMLADVIDTRGPLPSTDALSIARQLAIGLADIHSQGIVHRDVKSQNVMITPKNEARLIDFGIAKSSNHSTLTDPTQFAGTLYYAPPEQILATTSVDHRADIYSLGVVLYEMLMSHLPVTAREFGTVASRIISGKLDPITGVSEPVETLVNGMLAHKLEHRIDSMAKVIQHIEYILGESSEPQLMTHQSISSTAIITESLNSKQVPDMSGYALVSATGQKLLITQAVTVIGRSHPRDSAVPDIDLWDLGVEGARTASRRHCRIVERNSEYFLEDMGSMNGTYLNDHQIEAGKTYPLSIGDKIHAGRVELYFQRSRTSK